MSSIRFYTYHFQFSSSLSGLPVLTKVPPSPSTPIQRSTFQAVCQAEGFPRPVISWRRVGMPFSGGRTELNNGTLTIKNLILADSGLYDCIATNAMGTKKTRINVVVQRKPGKLRDILKVVFQRGFNTALIFFLMLRRSLNSSAETAKNVVLHFLSTRIFRKRFVTE